MRFLNVLIFVLFTFIFNPINAQDTITLLSGKVIDVEILEADSFSVTYNQQKKRSIKQKTISTEMIFDIKYHDGRMDTLYHIRPDLDLYLTREEMQYFILGEQDAQEHYKTTLTTIIGLAFGGGFGYLLNDGFYVAAVPLVYTIGAGVSTISIKNNAFRGTSILSHPAYQEGFIKVARSKKAFSALASSVVGTFVGVLIGNSIN